MRPAPKDKAIYLYEIFYKKKLTYYPRGARASKLIGLVKSDAKDCALIVVNEILNHPFEQEADRQYWQKVKLEISGL